MVTRLRTGASHAPAELIILKVGASLVPLSVAGLLELAMVSCFENYGLTLGRPFGTARTGPALFAFAQRGGASDGHWATAVNA
jgi:hypothetical protein